MTRFAFPGNADALEGEVRRLRELSGELDSLGDAVRALAIDKWAGPAREAFEHFRQRYRKRLYEVAELHDDAARHLDRYHQTLVELRGRATGAETVPGTVDLAADDLERWHGQLQAQAHTTAHAIRKVAKTLAGLTALLPSIDEDHRTDAAAPRSAATPVPPVGPASRPLGLDIRTVFGDLAGFQRDVDDLRAQIATAKLIVAGP